MVGLKWSHFEWPYESPCPRGLNWCHLELYHIVGSPIDLLGLNWSHFEWPTGKLHPQMSKWSHSDWCGLAVAKASSVGLNCSYLELHSQGPPTRCSRIHILRVNSQTGWRLHTLLIHVCYPMWAPINLIECPMFEPIYAEGENVMFANLLQKYLSI